MTVHDACPCCGRHDNPPALTAERRGVLVAVYRCTACRHGWWTAWNPTVLDQPTAHGAAA